MNSKSKQENNFPDYLDRLTETNWFKIISILSAFVFAIFIGGKVMKVVASTVNDFKSLQQAFNLSY